MIASTGQGVVRPFELTQHESPKPDSFGIGAARKMSFIAQRAGVETL
jgi:hypothetical protein